MITKTCPVCGKEFQVKPYLQDRIKFCCKECRYKHVYPEIGYKRCYLCGEIKPLDAFSLMSHTKHVSGKGRQMACKECAIIKQREWRRANPEKTNEQCRAQWKKRPLYQWARSSVVQHIQRGYDVEFSAIELRDYILDHEITKCAICGRDVVWGQHKGKSTPNSPTIDRRENGKVLNFENMQILCRDCNTTKGSRTMSEFIAYCKLVVEKFG